ncbi:AEC family transporter [Lentibacillus sediminis]|uniref:AEC family transporter n=1 Tax=Lentibacillus sediminis TaxID=1940529 RepID=UPI000C1B8823|nr:AEC family transporter [Lentibacillus sediminis]
MLSAGAFLQEMLYLYSLALVGFLVRKNGVLNENTNQVLTQLILYITLPALILFSLNISFSPALIQDFLWLLGMSAYVLLAAVFLAAWMRKRADLLEWQHGAYEGLIIFGNQGFIGYAVIFIVFGEQGIVYLTMFNLIYFVLIWTYGIFLFTKNTAAIEWRRLFFNPGIVSTGIGLVVLFSPFRWPDGIAKGLESVGNMTIPLSMMLIGSLIANVKYKDFLHLLKNRYIWKAALAKLLLIPLSLLPFVLVGAPFFLLLIAVLVSGMPSAPTMSLYAQKFGGDRLFASLGVVVSSLLCIVTIPFLYLLVSLLY